MQKTNSTVGESAKDYFVITIAMGIISAGVYFFMVASNIVIGSVTGVAMVLAQLFAIRVSILTFILNAILLLLGLILVGKDFGAKTIYATCLMSVYLFIFEILFPAQKALSDNQLVNIICYSLIVSYGQTLIFNKNASAGGLDIVAKILNKYLHFDLGKGLILAGTLAALSSIFVYDMETVVMSVLGTYIGGEALDKNLAGFQSKYRICVISQMPNEIRQYIMNELKCGVSIYTIRGGYQDKERKELSTILDRNEYQKLMDFLNRNDPDAFITVSTVREVIGGWRRPKRKLF